MHLLAKLGKPAKSFAWQLLHLSLCDLPYWAAWAARYNTWLLIELTPKGVVFSFVLFSFHLPYLNRYVWVHGTRAVQRSSSAGVRPVCLGWHPVVSAVRCAAHASLYILVHSYPWHTFPAPWSQCSCMNATVDAAWLAGLVVLSDPWTHALSTTQWKLLVLLYG